MDAARSPRSASPAVQGPSARTAGGFTLLELLVVVVILGVLGTVVIVNTRAVGDRGRAASCAYDRQTLRVAQEAVWAKTDAYTTEPGLVSAGFLEGESVYWDVTLTSPTVYSLVPQAGSPCP